MITAFRAIEVPLTYMYNGIQADAKYLGKAITPAFPDSWSQDTTVLEHDAHLQFLEGYNLTNEGSDCFMQSSYMSCGSQVVTYQDNGTYLNTTPCVNLTADFSYSSAPSNCLSSDIHAAAFNDHAVHSKYQYSDNVATAVGEHAASSNSPDSTNQPTTNLKKDAETFAEEGDSHTDAALENDENSNSEVEKDQTEVEQENDTHDTPIEPVLTNKNFIGRIYYLVNEVLKYFCNIISPLKSKPLVSGNNFNFNFSLNINGNSSNTNNNITQK